MRTYISVGLNLLLVLALAAPVAAEHQEGCRDQDGNLVLTQEEAWISDTGGVKAGNLAAAGAADFPSWDDSEPTASVTTGAGGGYAASSVGVTTGQGPWDERFTATIKGTFDGCVDTMGVTLHMFAQIDPAVLNYHLMAARLSAGDTVLAEATAAEVATHLNPNGSGDITYVLPFAFRDLVRTMELAGLDPAATHDLTLQVRPEFSDVGHVGYVWDTSEVPSGIVFNTSSLGTYTVLN